MPIALIIDYLMGNTDSMKRALEESGARVIIGNEPRFFEEATHIILPGVGSFFQGMTNLNEMHISEQIKEQVFVKGKPVLGVCLGMQMLATKGTEGCEISGLGLIDGIVELMVQKDPAEKIPHVGWNDVIHSSNDPLFSGIPSGKDFYFVHSYHMKCDNENDIIGRTKYCGEIVSAVHKGSVWGTQFHPEKSQRMGFQILKNFLAV